MKQNGEVYKYHTFYYKPHRETKISQIVERAKILDVLIGKKIVDAFHCYMDGDYYATILLLDDGTELDISPDGEYGDCMLRIDGDEIQ